MIHSTKKDVIEALERNDIQYALKIMRDSLQEYDITSVCVDDLRSMQYIGTPTEQEMEWIANDMAEAYTGSDGFWTDLSIIADNYDIMKAETLSKKMDIALSALEDNPELLNDTQKEVVNRLHEVFDGCYGLVENLLKLPTEEMRVLIGNMRTLLAGKRDFLYDGVNIFFEDEFDTHNSSLYELCKLVENYSGVY